MRKKVYKIQRKSDGLYADGSSPPAFIDGGYVWDRRADVIDHLAAVSAARQSYWPYEGCELISYGVELRSRTPINRPGGSSLDRVPVEYWGEKP